MPHKYIRGMSDKLFVFNLGIEDSLWSSSMYIMIAFVYVILGITFSSKYLNRELECDPNLLTFLWMFSWIFGNDAKNRVDKCMTKDKQTLAHYIQNPVVQKVNDAKYVLDKNMNEINANMDRLQNAYNKSEGKTNNLAIAIQNNILAVKEGMQKIIASLIIQRHMQDGNLTVVKQTKNYDTMFKQVLDAVKK